MTTSTLLNGILLGGFYGSVALGLSLVFGVLRIVNLAHGEFVIGGAYLSLLFTTHLSLPVIVTVPLVAVAAAAVGYGLQRTLFTRLLRSGAESALVATFGLALMLQGVFAVGFSSDPQSLPTSLSTAGVDVFGTTIRGVYLLSFVVAVMLCVGTHLALTRSRLGAVVRAAAADPDTAGVMGIDVPRVHAWTFAFAAMVAAISGVLVGITFSFSPSGGAGYLLTGMAVVVLGGVGNVAGTLIGGLAIGIVQASSVELFGGGYRDLVVYLVFFLTLVLRPTGLTAGVAR